MTGFVTGSCDTIGVKGQHSPLPMEMEMKTAASALALAVLISNPASATKLDLNDHHFETIVHVEVVGANHDKPGKKK
jgi:hypothetical protein